MTRYRVLVAAAMLEMRKAWMPVEGFRLVAAERPWAPLPGTVVCMFEDDQAPPELEGRLVRLTFGRRGRDAVITGRKVVAGP